MLNFIKRTKIVATLGPSTDVNNILEKLILNGVDILRLNFSHGTSSDHKNRVRKVQEIMKKTKRYVAILGDLQGPKIRIGKFKNNKICLKKGDRFVLDYNFSKTDGNKKIVQVEYSKLSKEVKKNDILLLDDGKIRLKVLSSNQSKVNTMVLIGGILSNKKGINKLGGGLTANCLTKKDEKDIELAAKLQVDYLAISFPNCAQDLIRTQNLLKKSGSSAKIIAKIERAEVAFNKNTIDEIINHSDAIMVARGDLGVEISDPELAGVQKNLISRAKQLNKIVITATQMMESMIISPVPTRAEVMDVANAVLDGTDAVMLSAETASGNYPVETVISMSNICQGAEKLYNKYNINNYYINNTVDSIEKAISVSAMYTASRLKNIVAIINLTKSNLISLLTSRIDSNLPIFSLTTNIKDLKIMTLYKGVQPIFFKKTINAENEEKQAINLLLSKKLLKSKNLVIIIKSKKCHSLNDIYSTKIIQI